MKLSIYPGLLTIRETEVFLQLKQVEDNEVSVVMVDSSGNAVSAPYLLTFSVRGGKIQVLRHSTPNTEYAALDARHRLLDTTD